MQRGIPSIPREWDPVHTGSESLSYAIGRQGTMTRYLEGSLNYNLSGVLPGKGLVKEFAESRLTAICLLQFIRHFYGIFNTLLHANFELFIAVATSRIIFFIGKKTSNLTVENAWWGPAEKRGRQNNRRTAFVKRPHREQ